MFNVFRGRCCLVSWLVSGSCSGPACSSPLCCWFTFFPALLRVPLAFIPHDWKSKGGVKTAFNEIGPGNPCLIAVSSLTSEKKQLDTHEGVDGDALCQQDSQTQHSHGQHVHSLPFSICSVTRKEQRDHGLRFDVVILAQSGTMHRGWCQGKEEQQRSREREDGNNRGAQGLSLLLLASRGLCVTAGATLEQQLVSAEGVVFCLLCPAENPFPCLYPPASNGTSQPVWGTHLVLSAWALCCCKPSYWALQPLVHQPPLLLHDKEKTF